MACMKHFILLALLNGVLCGSVSAQGLLPVWEVEEMAKTLDQNAGDARKLLEQVRPQEWIQNGASNAYVGQYETLLTELSNLSLSAQNLLRNPQKISVAVDTFLWLDRSWSMLNSIADGVRRYQNAALADLLISVSNRGTGAGEKLKEYMGGLAADREAQLEIAHSEAQRCRQDLFQQTPRD